MERADGARVVLVHGAFHDSWCWALTLERLDRAGVAASAIDLPLTSYADDLAALRAALNDEPCVLVAHSYAGLLVSEVGQQAAHIVFVAARMPRPGESPLATTGTWGNPEFRSCWRPRDDGGFDLDPSGAPHLYGRTPANIAGQAIAHLRPHWSAVPNTPAADPAWTTVPNSYVVCTEDLAVQVNAQRECAARADYAVELPTDHSPFLSVPDELTAVILRAVALTSGHSTARMVDV